MKSLKPLELNPKTLRLRKRERGSEKDREIESTKTPTVCRRIAFWAGFGCFGLLFFILLGFRYNRERERLDLGSEVLPGPQKYVK